MNSFKLLLIDSILLADYQYLKKQLQAIPNISFKVDLVDSIEEAKLRFQANEYDGYIIQEEQKKESGVELLKYARNLGLQKPLVILAKQEDRQKDIIAMMEGADDYIVESEMSVANVERSLRYSYERYKARLRIAQRELRYRNLFERSVNPIVIVDTELIINESNRSFVQLLKTSAEELISKSIGLFFLHEERYLEFKNRVENEGLIKKFKATLLTTSQQKLHCEITTIPLYNVLNEVSGYQLIINDYSQVKKQEQRLLRMEKLGLTGRIARSIAHEIRNPLTNINLSLEYLKEYFKEDKERMFYFEIIERNSHRINNLIEDLLQSSKPTSLKIEEQSINALLEETVKLAKDRARLNNIKIVKDFGGDIRIPFDFDKLRDALLNILINAVEAVEERGIVKITKSILPGEVMIEINDNGKGIDDEALKNMFEPFFTAKERGMGLGLTSTKNIIAQHRGQIDVDSELGVGTSFFISLPKAYINI